MHIETSMERQDREGNKSIWYCSHCFEELGMTKRTTCDYCARVARRNEMCKNNLAINPAYVCKTRDLRFTCKLSTVAI